MSRISIFELFEDSKKALSKVNPKVADLAKELIKLAYHNGINVQITSGLRTFAEQDKLYAQGRTTKGSIVTNAKGGQSVHNYGYAIDYALVYDNETVHWNLNADLNNNKKKDWYEVAAIAKRLGFEWGGDWVSFKDYPHLQLMDGLRLTHLQQGKRPTVPNVPKRDYLAIGDTGKEVTAYQKEFNKMDYKLTVDGIYGEGVKSAVADFQKKHKLTPDGVLGKKTISMLKLHV